MALSSLELELFSNPGLANIVDYNALRSLVLLLSLDLKRWR
jgi:hypothetical protein